MELTLMKGGTSHRIRKLWQRVVTKGGGDDGKWWRWEVVRKGSGDDGKRWWRGVVRKGGGDNGKWWGREVVTMGSDDEGEWWGREVGTMGSGEEGKWTKGGGDDGRWWWWEVVRKGSGDEARWWWWEVVTMGSGEEGKWWRRQVVSWGGSRSTKPCVFRCQVAAAGDERYLCVLQQVVVSMCAVLCRRWKVPRLCGGCGCGRFAFFLPHCNGGLKLLWVCLCVRRYRVFWNLWLQIAVEWLHDCCHLVFWCCSVRR